MGCWQDTNEFLVSGLIEIYMKCRTVKDANYVFRNTIHKGLIKGNTGDMGCEHFSLMYLMGVCHVPWGCS